MKDYEDLSKKMEEQNDLLKVLIAEIRYMQIAMEARYLNKKIRSTKPTEPVDDYQKSIEYYEKIKESLDEANKTKP